MDEASTFGDRLSSLFRFDCIRLARILETAQYALIFSLLALIVGIVIDSSFKQAYNKIEARASKDGRQLSLKGTPGLMLSQIGLIFLQVVISAILVIYIRKVGKLPPFILNFCGEDYVQHHKVNEVEGEIAIAIIFVGVQTGLIHALEKVREGCSWD